MDEIIWEGIWDHQYVTSGMEDWSCCGPYCESCIKQRGCSYYEETTY